MGTTEGKDDEFTQTPRAQPGTTPATARSFLAGLDFVGDNGKQNTDDANASNSAPQAALLAGMDWMELPAMDEHTGTPTKEHDDDGVGNDSCDDESDPTDHWMDDEENDLESAGDQIDGPNGIDGFHYVLLGTIRGDWPDEDCDHIEPNCIADDESVRIYIAWSRGSIAVQIDGDVTEYRYDAETDEYGEDAQERLRIHIRSFLEARPQWALEGAVLDDAVSMMTATELEDVLDGDEDERGWRCDSGQYQVSGWNGRWGELPESPEEADYTGGFYLSVVSFTNREQAKDATNLGVSRNAHGDLENIDLLAAVSELDHSYIVAARKAPKGIAGKKRATISEPTLPRPLPTACTIESPPSVPTRHHAAEQSGTRPTARAKSTSLIALVIVTGLVLAALMYAYSKFIAPREGAPQPPDTAQVLAPAPAIAETDAALPVDAPSKPIATTVAGPSAGFDCAKASTEVEAMICGSPQLGALDAMLGANYRIVKAADIGAAQQAELMATQRHWLTQRDACHDLRCLADAYMQRIEAICDYRLQSGQASPCVRLQPGAPEDAVNTPTTEGAASTPDSPAGSNTRNSNPGFDCSMHTGVVEQAICADAELGDLHREMAQKHAALSYVVATGDVLKATQDFWMESRDRCRDRACLVAAYEARIRDLDEYAASKH
ncbi:MAG: hypothetical protein IPH14_06555 [Thermomonas sp.]|uniref:lysozyme inhibitor LprI family protein n=1 Tax=Thermomonas sp. TaxID=1971895 RepID=UPI0025F73498|nr:hypothetical protein [Thermomonas sp.]MBK6924918.1 hypothetical protein [Thermomonas sp.]